MLILLTLVVFVFRNECTRRIM